MIQQHGTFLQTTSAHRILTLFEFLKSQNGFAVKNPEIDLKLVKHSTQDRHRFTTLVFFLLHSDTRKHLNALNYPYIIGWSTICLNLTYDL